MPLFSVLDVDRGNLEDSAELERWVAGAFPAARHGLGLAFDFSTVVTNRACSRLKRVGTYQCCLLRNRTPSISLQRPVLGGRCTRASRAPDCLWFSQEHLEHACNSAELARGYQAETFACVCYKTAFKQWKCCLVMRNAIGRLIPLFKEELLKVAAGKGPPVPQLCSPASSSS